jgi:hypothetical protein
VKQMRRHFPYVRTGSHYILVFNLENKKDGYNLTFWDDDGIQDAFLDHDLFQHSVFGLVASTKMNTSNANQP